MTVKVSQLCLTLLLEAGALMLFAVSATGGVFVSATESDPARILHPTGYTGTGGTLTVDVCIDSASPNAAAMVLSVQNIVATVNAREAHIGNLWSGTTNNVPASSPDFESVALHEVGHCIGLAHSNLASESGLSGGDRDFAKSADGADNTYDLGRGLDNHRATGDDLRDDDTSYHYFDQSTNDPYRLTASVVDSTTYSRNLANLPGIDTYPASADRYNNSDYSVLQSTEAVMNQGTFFDEEQRLMTADDVSAIRYAMSGLDEIEGTSDDYTLQLNYVGLASSCDLKLDFDNAQTGFAVCSVSWQRIGNPTSKHDRITSANVYFNTGYSWFFNDETCGNGTLEGTEQCDDGGVSGGDGCDQTCNVESGWLCSGEPSSCGEVCGDGLIVGAETCDDSGTTSGDGCDAFCAVESGWLCSGEPSSCDGICGDGLIRGSETCDDAGTTSGDGCDSVCQIELTWTCVGEPSVCTPPVVPAVSVSLRRILILARVGLAAMTLGTSVRRRSA